MKRLRRKLVKRYLAYQKVNLFKHIRYFSVLEQEIQNQTEKFLWIKVIWKNFFLRIAFTIIYQPTSWRRTGKKESSDSEKNAVWVSFSSLQLEPSLFLTFQGTLFSSSYIWFEKKTCCQGPDQCIWSCNSQCSGKLQNQEPGVSTSVVPLQHRHYERAFGRILYP